MNALEQLLRGGTPQRPAAYPTTEDENFALMNDAGWFNAPQGPQVTQFDPMANDSRLGNAPQVEKEKNALNALFQGAIFAGDLDKASRLAVTPEQQALLGVAYAQRTDRQAGVNSNPLGDYQRAQETTLARTRMEEDRQAKMAEMAARTNKINAEAGLRAKQAQIAGLPKPGSMLKTPETEVQKAFSNELAKLDAKELDDMRNSSQKAQSGIERIKQMRDLAKAGVYSGTLAEPRVAAMNFVSTLAETAGLPFDASKLRNSQEYMKHAKELTLSVLKEGVGTSQISNADLKFVNDTVPQLETNPEARQKLLDFIEWKLQTSVDRFSKADEYARANNGLRGFKYQPEPPAVSRGTGNSVTLPDGRTKTFPNAAAADAFKKAAGL